MATETFIAGPVARNSATASGIVTSALRCGTLSCLAASSIAGSEARLDWVEIATACAGIIARAKSRNFQPANATATT